MRPTEWCQHGGSGPARVRGSGGDSLPRSSLSLTRAPSTAHMSPLPGGHELLSGRAVSTGGQGPNPRLSFPPSVTLGQRGTLSASLSRLDERGEKSDPRPVKGAQACVAPGRGRPHVGLMWSRPQRARCPPRSTSPPAGQERRQPPHARGGDATPQPAPSGRELTLARSHGAGAVPVLRVYRSL